MSPLAGRAAGAQEIGFTVLSISVSLVAVFIPILLMGGIIGRLFREFAVTLSVAIAVSMVVSLTTTPMMCAWLLKAKDEEEHGRIYRASEAVFQWVLNRYESMLRWVLRHQFLMIILTIATVGFTGFLYVIVRKGFFPTAGHQPSHWNNPGRPGHVFSDHERPFEAVRQDGGATFRRRQRDCVYGRRWRGRRSRDHIAQMYVASQGRQQTVGDSIARPGLRLFELAQVARTPHHSKPPE